MTQQKTARLFTVPIVMDPSFENTYLELRQELDDTAQRLLGTAGDRIRAARANTATPEEATAAGNALAAEDHAVLSEIQARLEAASKDLDKYTQGYKFRALGRKTFKQLYADNPPTDEDRAQWAADGEEGEPPYNEDGFARDLIQRACVSPVLSKADVDEMFDGEDWNPTELGMLFVGAQHIQTQGTRV